MTFRRLAFCAAAVLVSGVGPALYGQTATGTILGHITDASGSVLPAVEVTAVNPEKGRTMRTLSDEQGIYRFFYLDPATYSLTFQKAGFATLQREGLALRSNDTLSVDVQLNVGNVVEKVEVNAEVFVTPEPGTFLLLGGGLVPAFLSRRRR